VGFATAAACWATVADGVLAGLGRELVAVAVAAMAVLVLEAQYFGFTEWVGRHKGWHRLERDSDPTLGDDSER
jgi:uncharacterized membrane protein YhiD involved in acid resistance